MNSQNRLFGQSNFQMSLFVNHDGFLTRRRLLAVNKLLCGGGAQARSDGLSTNHNYGTVEYTSCVVGVSECYLKCKCAVYIPHLMFFVLRLHLYSANEEQHRQNNW